MYIRDCTLLQRSRGELYLNYMCIHDHKQACQAAFVFAPPAGNMWRGKKNKKCVHLLHVLLFPTVSCVQTQLYFASSSSNSSTIDQYYCNGCFSLHQATHKRLQTGASTRPLSSDKTIANKQTNQQNNGYMATRQSSLHDGIR